MKRKILGYGYSKLVTLPKQWLRLNDIRKGDAVNIEMTKTGDLIIKKILRTWKVNKNNQKEKRHDEIFAYDHEHKKMLKFYNNVNEQEQFIKKINIK